MNMIIAVVLPILFGALLPFLKIKNRSFKLSLIALVLVLELCLGLGIILGREHTLVLWSFSEGLSVSLRSDALARFFIAVFTLGWLLVAVFSFVYMKHEENEDRFYAFYLLSEGALVGLSLAGNLLSMYVFFELVTLLSMPLVLHSLSKEAISAALKYLFYSLAGAFMALLGIFILHRCSINAEFVPGGGIDAAAVAGGEKLLLAVIFITVIGFGTKAGIYPMHGWLPTAHPVAPAPASAVLSALIAKAGVLAIIRIIFYVVGVDFLRGTWVQTALLTLSLLTVFMGSMMAYREKLMKKRLAYSTVSQISYILTALFLFSEGGFTGALLHLSAHAAVKCCLFLTAGAVIFYTGKTRVDELGGLGRKMPVIMWCYTISAISLIGIPPTGGFVSKWYIAAAALESDLGVFSWLVPVVLLISALLTAGYLLPISIAAFFPGKDAEPQQREESPLMWLPMAVLAAAALILGLCSGKLADFASGLASMVV